MFSKLKDECNHLIVCKFAINTRVFNKLFFLLKLYSVLRSLNLKLKSNEI